MDRLTLIIIIIISCYGDLTPPLPLPSYSGFPGPPAAPAGAVLLPGDTAGCQRGCQGNGTPATPQPIPAPAGRRPPVQGEFRLFLFELGLPLFLFVDVIVIDIVSLIGSLLIDGMVC